MIEKCAITLHSCISIMNEVKINEQDISIGQDPSMYNRIELSCQKIVSLGVMSIASLAGENARSQNLLYHKEMVYEVL